MKKSNETKKIIINGDFTNFEGSTLYISTTERTLADMGRRELKNLYKSSESVRSAAKKKAQEKHLEEIESYLYKTIPVIIETIKGEISKNNCDNTTEAATTIPKFKDGSKSAVTIDAFVQGLTMIIGGSLKHISEDYIKNLFFDNPVDLFKDEEKDETKISYKVKNGKIIKVIEKTA